MDLASRSQGFVPALFLYFIFFYSRAYLILNYLYSFIFNLLFIIKLITSLKVLRAVEIGPMVHWRSAQQASWGLKNLALG